MGRAPPQCRVCRRRSDQPARPRSRPPGRQAPEVAMASKLGVYNSTFLHLGERSIAGLTEDAEPKRDLDEIWNDGILYCLQQGLWNFAKRTIEGSVVASISPPFGEQFAFT